LEETIQAVHQKIAEMDNKEMAPLLKEHHQQKIFASNVNIPPQFIINLPPPHPF
jgi:hypothetical protein